MLSSTATMGNGAFTLALVLALSTCVTPVERKVGDGVRERGSTWSAPRSNGWPILAVPAQRAVEE